MLSLYRRHRKYCEAERPEESRSGEFEERKKGWKRCACLIFASGTLGGKFSRKCTGKADWAEAKAVTDAWERAGTCAYRLEEYRLIDEPPARATTIHEATEAFLANRKHRGIEVATLSKYQTFVKQLRAYTELQGYVVMSQLTVADMDRFYASWKDDKRARAKKLERLKGFVAFCVKRKWLDEHIAEDLRAPEGSSIPANRTPFTDAEMMRIYAACDALGGPTPWGPGYREWSGEDVKDFIMLSVYTGLRISDVATFDISKRLHGNDVFLRMHKTKKELYTWIPDWLVARLKAREKKHGAVIFRCGTSNVMRTMSETWRVKVGKVFAFAGAFEEKPVPHRFRHTFVRILLEKGVGVADVAELIGDTEEVVRRHYSKWVRERQMRLTRILKEAFEEKPKLVVMPSR